MGLQGCEPLRRTFLTSSCPPSWAWWFACGRSSLVRPSSASRSSTTTSLLRKAQDDALYPRRRGGCSFAYRFESTFCEILCDPSASRCAELSARVAQAESCCELSTPRRRPLGSALGALRTVLHTAFGDR